jgi:hypothetical protein
MSLRDRILAGDAIDDMADFLNGLDFESRRAEVLSLGPKAQRALWDLTVGRAVTLDEMVPPDRGPLETVRHFGRNTLPAFKLFEKRFCRPAADAPNQQVLWGYNEGTARHIIGPGYFICRATPDDSRGAAVVDYYNIPPGKPVDWPKIRPNEWGLQTLVYSKMHDFLRKVSEGVTIGRAYKKDRQTPNYFMLCRQD